MFSFGGCVVRTLKNVTWVGGEMRGAERSGGRRGVSDERRSTARLRISAGGSDRLLIRIDWRPSGYRFRSDWLRRNRRHARKRRQRRRCGTARRVGRGSHPSHRASCRRRTRAITAAVGSGPGLRPRPPPRSPLVIREIRFEATGARRKPPVASSRFQIRRISAPRHPHVHWRRAKCALHSAAFHKCMTSRRIDE